ncbi:hypothetical protein SBI_00259 [Streptomyces bingchenggensis BCW-1]|uniref:Uncharacterized protein n=1 Tax=Streptomyces bingchenggensis (strain BCW-1) TaxID=749414 RepID=D7BWM4_STRBB|nr:hypothetical protein SBI_00259 [Streptomyces bingchenggensis BCW-1]
MISCPAAEPTWTQVSGLERSVRSVEAVCVAAAPMTRVAPR